MNNFTFTFTEEELNLVFRGLGELPAKLSLELIQKLSKEAQEQQKEQKSS